MKAAMTEATVVCKQRYSIFCRLVLHCPEIASRARAGQFVNLYCDPQLKVGYQKQAPFLPRPFSVMKLIDLKVYGSTMPCRRSTTTHHPSPDCFELLFNIVGVGTQYLAGLKEGEGVRVLGPLGQGFWWEDKSGGERDDEVGVVVGGGVGIAPMPIWVEELSRMGKRVVGFLGALNEQSLPLEVRDTSNEVAKHLNVKYGVAEFEKIGVPSTVALEEHAPGYFHGTVVDMLKRWLNENPHLRIRLYACGPIGMLKAVKKLALERKIPCQLSLEERMACGFGICMGCACKVKDLTYKLVCVDGPVFDAGEVVL